MYVKKGKYWWSETDRRWSGWAGNATCFTCNKTAWEVAKRVGGIVIYWHKFKKVG